MPLVGSRANDRDALGVDRDLVSGANEPWRPELRGDELSRMERGLRSSKEEWWCDTAPPAQSAGSRVVVAAVRVQLAIRGTGRCLPRREPHVAFGAQRHVPSCVRHCERRSLATVVVHQSSLADAQWRQRKSAVRRPRRPPGRSREPSPADGPKRRQRAAHREIDSPVGPRTTECRRTPSRCEKRPHAGPRARQGQ